MPITRRDFILLLTGVLGAIFPVTANTVSNKRRVFLTTVSPSNPPLFDDYPQNTVLFDRGALVNANVVLSSYNLDTMSISSVRVFEDRVQSLLSTINKRAPDYSIFYLAPTQYNKEMYSQIKSSSVPSLVFGWDEFSDFRFTYDATTLLTFLEQSRFSSVMNLVHLYKKDSISSISQILYPQIKATFSESEIIDFGFESQVLVDLTSFRKMILKLRYSIILLDDVTILNDRTGSNIEISEILDNRMYVSQNTNLLVYTYPKITSVTDLVHVNLASGDAISKNIDTFIHAHEYDLDIFDFSKSVDIPLSPVVNLNLLNQMGFFSNTPDASIMNLFKDVEIIL